MYSRFATGFIFLILALNASENSLLSRMRNPTEFVAPEDGLEPEDLEPEMYADLLEEVPELRTIVRRPLYRDPLEMPYLKAITTRTIHDYSVTMTDAGVEDNATAVTTVMTTVSASKGVTAVTAEQEAHNASGSRSYWSGSRSYWSGPKVATCFTCGSEDKRVIPRSSICHDAWNSPDWRARTMARFFRARCYRNTRHWGSRIETKWIYSRFHRWDRGLIRGYYGWYTGGCYKRFLDVGEVYTSRGCRSRLPTHGAGFASHRFQKLELLLHRAKDACVVSPHASLTPFSRGISLYVRYHVCVCTAKYCNSAAPSPPPSPPHLLIILVYLVL